MLFDLRVQKMRRDVITITMNHFSIDLFNY